jgi:hypothetical protein
LQHELSIAVAADLFEVFGCTVPKLSADKIKHIQAIRDLTVIMAGQQTDPPTVDAPTSKVVAPCPKVTTTPPPRVATTSNIIATHNAIGQMTFIHQLHTRNNNPFHILTNDDDNNDTVIAKATVAYVPHQPSHHPVPHQ